MPGPSRRLGHRPMPAKPGALEVATTSADETSAHLRITGRVTDRGVALLDTVLRTHLRAGRRYLRLDLSTGELSAAALRCVADTAHAAAAVGGALVVENAPPEVAAAIASVKRTPAHA